MPFENPITIREVMDRIDQRKYLLPAIQREFVWDTDQVTQLFDSLLRGYPIGSFLFWTVVGEGARDYQFYEFLRDYHARDATHNPKMTTPLGSEVTAILALSANMSETLTP